MIEVKILDNKGKKGHVAVNGEMVIFGKQIVTCSEAMAASLQKAGYVIQRLTPPAGGNMGKHTPDPSPEGNESNASLPTPEEKEVDTPQDNSAGEDAPQDAPRVSSRAERRRRR